MSLKRNSEGLPLALDPDAASVDSNLPGFLAPPDGAPPYHGFPLINGVAIEGFKLGVITAFEAGVTSGDAFIEAPDGGRAGLVWELSPTPFLREVIPFDAHRWGVWEISFPCGYQSSDDVERILCDIVPRLRTQWKDWRKGRVDD